MGPGGSLLNARVACCLSFSRILSMSILRVYYSQYEYSEYILPHITPYSLYSFLSSPYKEYIRKFSSLSSPVPRSPRFARFASGYSIKLVSLAYRMIIYSLCILSSPKSRRAGARGRIMRAYAYATLGRLGLREIWH